MTCLIQEKQVMYKDMFNLKKKVRSIMCLTHKKTQSTLNMFIKRLITETPW